MQINSPEEFIRAVNASLMYMNREQRIAFIRWVKERINQYNFNYPQGYKEPTNEQTVEQTGPINSTPVSTPAGNQPIIDAVVVEPSVSEGSTNSPK